MHADLGMHAITVSRIKRSTTNPILVLTATGSGADDMAAAIGDFAPDVSVATFPSWETLPHERLSPSFDTVGRRTHLLRRIAHADPQDPLLLPVDVFFS